MIDEGSDQTGVELKRCPLPWTYEQGLEGEQIWILFDANKQVMTVFYNITEEDVRAIVESTVAQNRRGGEEIND